MAVSAAHPAGDARSQHDCRDHAGEAQDGPNGEVDSGRHDHQQLTQRQQSVYRRLAENIHEVVKCQKVIGESRQNGAHGQQRQHGAQAAQHAQRRAAPGTRPFRSHCRRIRHSFPSCRKFDNSFLGGVRPGQFTGNSSAVHDQDTIRHAQDFVNLGRDYHNTGALARQTADEVMDFRFGVHIDAARRLIEKIDTRSNAGAIFRGRSSADCRRSAWLPAGPGWTMLRADPAPCASADSLNWRGLSRN